MRELGAEKCRGEEEEVLADGGDPNWPQELRPAEGQAFQRHRQVCYLYELLLGYVGSKKNAN